MMQLRKDQESAHPHPIGPRQVVQGCLDRSEKGPALLPPVLLRQPVRDGVEVLVLPAIVAGHALHIPNADHWQPSSYPVRWPAYRSTSEPGPKFGVEPLWRDPRRAYRPFRGAKRTGGAFSDRPLSPPDPPNGNFGPGS